MLYDIIIIGGGPAGVASAVYAARKQLAVLMITESIGGQSEVSADIENWIGEKNISGFDLAKKFEEHVRAYPDRVTIQMPERAVSVRSVKCIGDGEERVCDFEVSTDKGVSYYGKTVILAAGARRRKLGVPGEETFAGKGVAYCSTCLPPDENIVANSSLRTIAEMQESQRVLTHDGSFQRVSEVMERDYQGELVSIRTRFFSEPVRLTPNHPVLSAKIKTGKAKNYWRDFEIQKPQWRRADQLTLGDALLYPVISTTKDIAEISLSKTLGMKVMGGMVKYKRGSPTSKGIPDSIKVTGDLLRLIGYYLAEGSITGKGVNLYFGKHEKEYIEDVRILFKRIFGLEVHKVYEGSVARVEVYSEIICNLFEKFFGKHSYNKKLPHWVLFLPKHKLVELVKGIYRGDGCKRDKDFCIVTNSRVLVYQLRDILLKLKIVPGIQRRLTNELNKTPGKIGDRIIRFRHDKYHIVVGGPWLDRMAGVLGIAHERAESRRNVCNHAWLKEGKLYLPIRSITREKYQGKVYNLAISKNNTYIAKNFIVHNCDAPLFTGKKVAVVGGGNAGLEAAEDLFPYASEVYILEYNGALRGDPVTQEHIKQNPKFKGAIFHAQTLEVLGEKFVTGVKYKDRNTGEEKILEVDGVFVEIGSVPNSEMVKDLVALDKFGQVVIDSKHGKTSHAGIFAAGDITDDPYKQNNISAGDAVKATLAAYAYLQKREKMSPAAEN